MDIGVPWDQTHGHVVTVSGTTLPFCPRDAVRSSVLGAAKPLATTTGRDRGCCLQYNPSVTEPPHGTAPNL